MIQFRGKSGKEGAGAGGGAAGRPEIGHVLGDETTG